MQTSLLSSLRKYSPREKTDPLENFLTEAFAWLLNNHTDFGGYFIDQISSRISIDSIKDGNGEWETQCNFDGVFPDMVYTWRNSALVFEHKTWSSLHKNQLQNYRDYASENFSESWIVLITATKQQHSQSPDLALCWDEVYQIIKYWISSNESASFIFEDFLGLLKEEGMGPPAPISHESILYYFTAKKLENSVIQLMQRVENSGWIPDVNRNEVSLHVSRKDGKAFKEQWGRVGFNYFSWKPALFVGIMLDGKDHSVTASNKNQGPDFCLILDFDREAKQKYPSNKYYKNLISNLETKVAKLNDGWQFYNHLMDGKARRKNKWHPIHIRKPMLKVFLETESAEQQEEIFCKTANELIKLVTEEDDFWSLRKALE